MSRMNSYNIMQTEKIIKLIEWRVIEWTERITRNSLFINLLYCGRKQPKIKLSTNFT